MLPHIFSYMCWLVWVRMLPPWWCRVFADSGVPKFLFSGVQQIQLSTGGRENGNLGGGSPTVRGSTRFANDWNPYSDCVVTELGIRLSFIKTLEFQGGGGFNPQTPLGTPLFAHFLQKGCGIVLRTRLWQLPKKSYHLRVPCYATCTFD
jgi:hypothetical protein